MSFMQTTGRFHARSRPRCHRCLHAQHPSSSHASSWNSSKTLFLFTSLRILCRTHEAISEFGPVRHLHFHYRPLAFVRIKVTVLIASLVLIIASLKELQKLQGLFAVYFYFWREEEGSVFHLLNTFLLKTLKISI